MALLSTLTKPAMSCLQQNAATLSAVNSSVHNNPSMCLARRGVGSSKILGGLEINQYSFKLINIHFLQINIQLLLIYIHLFMNNL